MKPLALAALLAVTVQAHAHRLAHNAPYVQSGRDGAIYARCVPAADAGTAGTTRIYRVGREKDELLDTHPWYAPEGVTLGWSPLVGKVAVAARPGMAAEELSFALGGVRLAGYSAAEVKAMGAAADVVRGVGIRAGIQVIGCEQVPGTNEYDFVVEAGGRRLRFDILTGGPRAAGR